MPHRQSRGNAPRSSTAMTPTGSGTPYIAVIGPSRASADELDSAREVGALLALRGAIVVCGGHGGVMEAVCEGAARIGLQPTSATRRPSARLLRLPRPHQGVRARRLGSRGRPSPSHSRGIATTLP
ncbi:hypothetical protein [Actinocrinis sp.]|uniref:SLOG cluster 4 domain-containing protein n=1 Tax=Actinocrinis sp. TaxID=1920516 RepID=UPI0032C21BBE